MITPITKALFIGLGSTGVSILHELRNLVFEEFGVYKLPVFEYIGIETAVVKFKPRDVQTLELRIPSTQKIQNELRGVGLSDKQKAMRDWLDDNLFDEYKSFMDGAAGCRLGGRLVLWDRWSEIQEAITLAKGNLKNQSLQREAETFLQQHYRKKGVEVGSVPLVESGSPILYVFGTFCGGTCSGMFIDLGFMLKHILGDSRRFGLFTVMEPTIVRGAEAPAANCYGACKEANFFYHPKTKWNYILPDGITPATPILAAHPYDLLYLLSTAGHSTKMEIKQLEQMIALTLLFDVICGQGTERAAMYADLDVAQGYHDVQPGGWCKSFHSLGLSALWYPKYRISGAAACKLGMEFCRNAAGKSQSVDSDKVKIVNLAKKDWKQIWAFCQTRLLRPGGKGEEIDVQKSIQALIDKTVKEKNAIRTQAVRLQTVFESDEIHSALHSLIDNIDNGIPNLKQEIAAEIRARAREHLERDLNLNAIAVYVQELKEACENELQKQKDCLKPDSISTARLDKIRRREAAVRRSKIIASVILTRPAVEDFREDYVNVYAEEWKNLAQHRADFYKKECLLWIREKLIDEELLLAQRGNTVEACRKKLEERMMQLQSTAGVPSNVKFVSRPDEKSKGNSLSFDQEVEICAASVKNRAGWSWATDETLLVEELKKEGEKVNLLWDEFSAEQLRDRIYEFYQRRTLEEIANFYAIDGIDTQIQKHLPTLRDSAEPYVEFVPAHESFAFHRPANYIIGNDHLDPNTQSNLIRNVKAPSDLQKCETRNISLEHMIFIYREERAFALNELKAFADFQKAYQRFLESNRQSDKTRCMKHHTHKDPDFFDADMSVRTEQIEMIFEVAGHVFPEFLFTKLGDQYVFYARTDSDIEKPIYLGNPESYRSLSRISTGKQQLETALRNTLRQQFTREEILERLNVYGKQLDHEMTMQRENGESTESLGRLLKQRQWIDDFVETILPIVYGK